MAFPRAAGCIAIALLVVCVYVAESAPHSSQISSGNIITRTRRDLQDFAGMINCATNKSEMDYLDYGCWCGFGGGGKQVDDVDRCCYVHDKCYDDIMASGICGYSWQVYFRTYDYTNCTTCQPASFYDSDDSSVPCKLALCSCDSEAAKCFARSTYNPQNYNYDTDKC